jgi:hypothetical protein
MVRKKYLKFEVDTFKTKKVIHVLWKNFFEFQPVVFKLCSGQGKVTKGNNSVISQDGVMVLVHCTLSQCA